MTGTINFWGPDGKPDEVNGREAARVGLELSPSEKSVLENAVDNLYANSATARSIIDEGLSESDIWIFKSPFSTSGGIPFSKVIRISLTEFSGSNPLQYMGSDGRLHTETPEDIVIHELIHAVYGWDDLIDPTTLEAYDDNDPRDYNNPNFDHIGATQRLANQVLLELGLAAGVQQVGYDAINVGSRRSYLRTDISYSEDNTVDIAYFDSPKSATPDLLDLSRRTDGSRDLIIGFEGADVINGGAGNDYLYGGVGDDVISGGSGDDVIHGGDRKTSTADDGTDTADYSKGDMQAGPPHGVTVDIDPALATTADKMDGLTPIIVSDDGYGGRDRLFSIEKIKLSGHADTVHIGKDSQDLLASLQEVDAGGNPNDQPDVLDFSKFGSSVTLKDLKIDGVDTTFKNFEKIVLSDKADSFRVASLGNLNGLQEVDAGDNPAGDPDIADFSQTTQSLQFANGSMTDGQASLKLTNFENLIGSAADDTIDLTNSTIKFVSGSAGNDTLTANGTGATLDGSIGNNVYVGGAGADKFVIGNGEFAQQGTSATFEIENAGADDRLVLRLDDTLGFGDAANWTKGIVLNGGIYVEDDPDWISAFSDSVVYQPTTFDYGGTGSDFVKLTQVSRQDVRPELGNYSIDYEWDKADSVLNIQVETSYGNFWVKVDDFQDGDLGLNFTAVDDFPEHQDIPTIAGENKIKASWASFDDAMSQYTQGAQIVDLESPGTPVAGSATRNDFFPSTVSFPNGGYIGPLAATWLDPWPGPAASMASLSAPSSIGATARQVVAPGADEANGQVLQLVQALATYPGGNAGFDPAGSSPLALPNDSGLQAAMTAAWHAAA